MRTQVLFLTFALLAVLTQSSSRQHHHQTHVQSKAHGGGGGGGGELASRGKAAARVWPCCDNCGGCAKASQRCQCLDAAPGGCHPACRDCVKSSLSADPPVYQCMDRVPNFCQRRCTVAAAAR